MKVLFLLLLTFTLGKVFAQSVENQEERVVCFEAKYYYPADRLAQRYSAFIAAENNPNGDENLLLDVTIDVDHSSSEARSVWRSIESRRRDQWLCANGFLTRLGEQRERLIIHLKLSMVMGSAWKVRSQRNAPEDAMILERY